MQIDYTRQERSGREFIHDEHFTTEISAATASGRPRQSRGPRFLFFAEEAAGAAAAKSAGIVRLSSNENPYGPSPQAFRAMTASFDLANRYPDDSADVLVEALAKLNGVQRGEILLGDGSGEILKLCADVFTGPLTNEKSSAGGTLVVAEPTFEAILYHAKLQKAEIAKVPLTSDYAHDLPKMLNAAKKGLVYICNPNNPTASITPAKEIRDFIEHAPNDTMILVDEAYTITPTAPNTRA